MSHDPGRRRRPVSARLTAAAVAVVSVLALQSSASADLEDTLAEDTRLPGQGLPGYAQDPNAIGGAWLGPQATSLNYLPAAKQWVRPPVFQAVAYNQQTPDLKDPLCTDRIDEGIQQRRDWQARVVLVNTAVAASSAARFGRTQRFTVRTVAFGAVPVEADIALSQPRNDQGAVFPADLTQRSEQFCPGKGPFPTRPPGGSNTSTHLSQAALDGAVSVEVIGFRVDGVEVGPLRTCAAVDAQLSLSAPEYFGWDPEPSPEERPNAANLLTTPFFNVANGGLLTGTLDVPNFTGCTTPGGDDVSRLLTATVSGDGNPVRIRSEGLTTEGFADSDDAPPNLCHWTGPCDNRLPQLDIPDGPPGG